MKNIIESITSSFIIAAQILRPAPPFTSTHSIKPVPTARFIISAIDRASFPSRVGSGQPNPTFSSTSSSFINHHFHHRREHIINITYPSPYSNLIIFIVIHQHPVTQHHHPLPALAEPWSVAIPRHHLRVTLVPVPIGSFGRGVVGTLLVLVLLSPVVGKTSPCAFPFAPPSFCLIPVTLSSSALYLLASPGPSLRSSCTKASSI